MLTIEQIARVVYAANREYSAQHGDISFPENPQPWHLATIEAGIANVITNPETTPEQSHESWLDHKRREGWVFGPVKDVALRQHPCMVPYKDLPPEQRRKDSLFLSIVNALLPPLE